MNYLNKKIHLYLNTPFLKKLSMSSKSNRLIPPNYSVV